MRISVFVVFVLILTCTFTCEARRRASSFRDDRYYQTSIQEVQIEIQQREFELEQDKYNLKQNRPTGKFSYAGHQEQIENKKRHLINLSDEYNECRQEGYCKGYSIPEISQNDNAYTNFVTTFCVVMFIIDIGLKKDTMLLYSAMLWVCIWHVEEGVATGVWTILPQHLLTKWFFVYISFRCGLHSRLVTQVRNINDILPSLMDSDVKNNLIMLQGARLFFRFLLRTFFSVPPVGPASLFPLCSPIFTTIGVVGIVYAGCKMALYAIQSFLFKSGSQSQVDENKVWNLALVLTWLIGLWALQDKVSVLDWLMWMWTVYVVTHADIETYFLHIFLCRLI